MARNEVKFGALFSYLLIVLNTFFGLFVTPYLLGLFGEAEYGVYKTISSLSNSMLVLDLGLGGTVMRYIAKYRADREERKISSFVSMAAVEAFALMVIVAIISVVLYSGIDKIYGGSFSVQQLAVAKKLFSVLAVNIGAHIIENLLNGIITGHNNFMLGNGIKLIRLMARIVLIYTILTSQKSAVALAMIDLALTLLSIFVELFYIKMRYSIKFQFSVKTWDRKVFFESFVYMLMLFLTSIVAQVNNNLDNIIIGAIRGAEVVTVYSFGLLIFGMFENLSTSISSVMLPTVTNAIKEDKSYRKVVDIIVKAGRVQFILLGAAFTGIVVLGKEFISLWLGKGFEDVYIISIILMGPALFELCVNVCLSVLRAKNMLGFRTGVLCAAVLLNILITVIGVTYFGHIAAAVGTAASFIVGSVIVMNIYYYKKFGFHMIRIYLKIFDRIWLCILISGAAIWLSSRYISGSWRAFFANVLIFGIVYCTTLLLFGLKREEKMQLPIVRRILKKGENHND